MAQGGRYDEIGQVFGRARPATGFSTDLATLTLRRRWRPPLPAFMPHRSGMRALEQRGGVAAGERVIRALPGAAAAPETLVAIDCWSSSRMANGTWFSAAALRRERIAFSQEISG